MKLTVFGWWDHETPGVQAMINDKLENRIFTTLERAGKKLFPQQFELPRERTEALEKQFALSLMKTKDTACVHSWDKLKWRF